MKDPPRWKDLGSDVEPTVREAMNHLARPAPLDAEILARLGARIGSIGAPAAGLSLATKALLAAALAGGIGAGVLREERPEARTELPIPSGVTRAIPKHAQVRFTPKPILAPRRAPEPAEPPTLGEEARLPLEARQHLALEPEQARASLQLHEHRFPQGKLREEREVLKLELACALGRSEELEASAQGILQRFPDSAHRERVERLRARCER